MIYDIQCIEFVRAQHKASQTAINQSCLHVYGSLHRRENFNSCDHYSRVELWDQSLAQGRVGACVL